MQNINISFSDTVSLSRSYQIHIGSGLLDREDLLLPILQAYPGKRVVIVSNETVAPLYLSQLRKSLERINFESVPIILPDGESHKNWQILQRIFDALLEAHCDRHTPLLALGGGVIGDMAGFAAACYQRGIPLIQVPTTLLSQVDSSVGGKTAINLPQGKNMVGAFYQPKLVLADINTLHTLPKRELRAGLAEIIKYALIRDVDFFNWLEENAKTLLDLGEEAITEAIYRSCAHKAAVVEADEKENGQRALLNLGHTFGHAIETGTGYGTWLHGEAVAAGTVMASHLSVKLGWLKEIEHERIIALFSSLGLPVKGADMQPEDYLRLMQHDKKVKSGKITLVLLKGGIGHGVLTDQVATSDIIDTISKCI